MEGEILEMNEVKERLAATEEELVRTGQTLIEQAKMISDVTPSNPKP